ncbi:DUF3047 domain-containing protein [Paracoccus sp. 1_MG-2023]|uniref:DUF3047 domain-containing protein n=1 Tax=unclassified Paracoccus (in: a-proteobacteria) TaxID=2688777 RepID=UPI001C08C74B|nr:MULTISPECIES: DUF3047 domain-containing protein [unclassified Paracoccus (in: a-proteobacteria)]MBU2957836.1 DUF3047 domain-containing protein [Paracoccus sp. C2R09]MDO6667316.1 DUF3047 domain-containing protein [Paracoccus sp. 1_MG-2023]
MRLAIPTAILLTLGQAAMAGPVSFANGWQEQRLSLFSTNDYRFGANLSMVSDGSVSIAWTRVPEADWNAGGASWNWTVEQSVPATDLSRKGGDDRNLSLYFVFVPQAAAPGLKGANIRSLLGNDQVRIIQYAWGGQHARGQVLPSPYGPQGQGVTIPLRQAGTGSHGESVDLPADYARAFGGSKGALIGLAVSGDSDDTDSVIRAAIGNLTLR